MTGITKLNNVRDEKGFAWNNACNFLYWNDIQNAVYYARAGRPMFPVGLRIWLQVWRTFHRILQPLTDNFLHFFNLGVMKCVCLYARKERV
jgi:hypothetical protein